MTKTKVAFFECDRGNLGTKINDFLDEQKKRNNGFNLISIQHSCGSASPFGVWATALILYSFTQEANTFA